MGKFELVQLKGKWGAKPRNTFVGESLAVVGWIPQYEMAQELPDGYFKSNFEANAGIRALLKSGNLEPPARFARGLSSFNSYLRKKEFRGALAIDAPTLYTDGENRISGIDFQVLSQVGATKLQKGNFVWYHDGVSAGAGEMMIDEHFAWFKLFLRMKLGSAGQVAAWLHTRQWPPWASLCIEYEFRTSPNGESSAVARFSGTAVPSQTRYLGWAVDSHYLIDQQMSEDAFKSFIGAGGCNDAMSTTHGVSITLRKFAGIPS